MIQYQWPLGCTEISLTFLGAWTKESMRVRALEYGGILVEESIERLSHDQWSAEMQRFLWEVIE